MPRTESSGVPLTTLLTELVTAAAANPGRPAGRKLPGGLCVAALHRQDRLILTTWRTASRLPSRKECEIVARDAGFSRPRFTTFERQDGILAFSITELPAPQSPPPSARPVSTRVDTETQKCLDEAERQRHIGVLLFCARVQGLRSAWFRRPDTLDARSTYLKGAPLDELREERRSRYGRVQLVIAVKLSLLLARWRLTFMALPVKAMARRARKARQPVAA